MPIHKLADGPITLQVASCEQVPNNFDPTKLQYLFIGTNDERVYVSQTATERQLPRLNLTAETCVGQVLTIEQVKKDGKTFTNINAGNKANVGAAAPAAPGGSAPARGAMSVAEIAAIYAQCVDAAVAIFGTKMEQAEVPITAEAMQAAAATMFIRASR